MKIFKRDFKKSSKYKGRLASIKRDRLYMIDRKFVRHTCPECGETLIGLAFVPQKLLCTKNPEYKQR